jgi:hypothetical protein
LTWRLRRGFFNLKRHAYSDRSATTGSTRAARRAGSHAANPADAIIVAITAANVAGSCTVV